ncbi:MAG: C25 family cysteine peptidase [Candidatus Omnitrophota bacterium]|nr:C25 family cysteine peptidase [Candidatus Omnitrophota bacterium]
MFRRSFLITLIAISVVLGTAFSAYPAGITIPASSTINVNTGILTVPGDVAITGTLQTTSGTIKVSGSWTNSGTFTAGTGTVEFYNNAVASTISKTTSFYNLTCTAVGKTLNFDAEIPTNNYRTNITNLLNFSGSLGSLITLARSGGTGTDQWAINPAGNKGLTPGWTVAYVTVSNSVNLNSNYINPDTSTNGGNNTNWFTPTLVKLTAFYAIGYFGKVEIYWKTASEYNNAGFNLYVSENKEGPYTKLNSALIPGLGTSTTGREYSYTDSNVVNGRTYYYKLEDVEFNGRTKMHGPVKAHPGLDSDGDGMTDDWEIYYGLDPYNPNDAMLDLDGDGLTNLEEFLHGTDPTQKEEQAQKGVRIISSDESGITFELVTAEFKATPKKIGRVTYQVLEIPGYEHGYTNEPGKPQMPLKSVLLGIPQGVSCAIMDLDFDVVELPGYNIYPVRSPRLIEDLRKTMIDKENLKAKKPESKKIESYLIIDKKFYSTDEYYPVDIVSLGFVGDMRGQRAACVNISPLTFNPARHNLKFYKRIRVKLQFSATEVNPPIEPPRLLPGKHSKVKVYTTKEGLHRIGWDELWNANFYDIMRLDPRKIRCYNKGKEIALRIVGEEDGIFNRYDYIEFYAQASNSKYSKENVYWLTYAQGKGLRMEDVPASTDDPAEVPDRFRAATHLEKNDFYWGERKGPEDIDRWFWNSYVWGGAQVNYPIVLKDINLLHPEDEARMKIAYYALFDVDHHTSTYLNNGLIDDVSWNGQDEHVVEINVPQGVLIEGDNTITIAAQLAPGVGYDLLVPNYFEVEYWRNFVADDDALNFSYKSVNGGVTEFNISGFTKDNVELFDITEPATVKYVTGFEVVFQSNGLYSLIFRYDFKPDEEKRFLALTPDKANLAERLKVDAPSNLSSSENKADYIIISYGAFKNNLYPLEKLYRNKRLNVSVVDVEDVYDEFNYGLMSPYAIKDFLRYAYNRWRHPVPTYVLLVGDANYDYRDYLGSGKINYVPAYLLPNTPYLGETASDNWFVCLDPPQLIDGQVQDDILPDMFIGRIPARNKDEVNNVVRKIVAYANLLSKEYSRKVTLAADDERLFEQISDNLVQYLPKKIIPIKLYLSSYTNYSQFTQGLINNINNGTILLNYVGHGSTNLWTQEGLFNTDTVGLLNNYRKYPFVVSFDCLDGYFLNLDEGFESLAEVFLRRRDAGAIACFSPTGMGIPEGHRALSEELFKSIFVDGNYRLGPATTKAKINFFSNTGGQYKDLIQTYTLFGDPALSLNIERNIKVKKIELLSDNKQPSLSTSADGFANILREVLANVEDSERWKDGSKESKGPED